MLTEANPTSGYKSISTKEVAVQKEAHRPFTAEVAVAEIVELLTGFKSGNVRACLDESEIASQAWRLRFTCYVGAEVAKQHSSSAASLKPPLFNDGHHQNISSTCM